MRFSYQSIFAVAFTSIVSWICAYTTFYGFRDYTMGLFVWLPMVLGALATLIGGYKRELARKELRNLSYLTLAVFCTGLIIFAWEGLICLAMAAPIGFICTCIGHWLGYAILRRGGSKAPAAAVLLAVSVPALMAFEHLAEGEEPLRSVTTSIEIQASPEEVWKHVIAFPQLKAPEEFIFKTGIAYPINATIAGQGVGAIRHCNFSTGSFVEPITVWKEPYQLQFSVTQQPETMKEISFYDIHPPHLNDYWVSKQGQFRLIRTKTGGTLLQGTTWYQNKIKPGFYWTWWSDYIVHSIHERVLAHIKEQAESPLH